MFEIRFYKTGWSLRFFILQFRYNKQENYCGFSIEWIRDSYLTSGGITWKEFRLAKQQQKKAAYEARIKAEAR